MTDSMSGSSMSGNPGNGWLIGASDSGGGSGAGRPGGGSRGGSDAGRPAGGGDDGGHRDRKHPDECGAQ
jgi:hypothetical protein